MTTQSPVKKQVELPATLERRGHKLMMGSLKAVSEYVNKGWKVVEKR